MALTGPRKSAVDPVRDGNIMHLWSVVYEHMDAAASLALVSCITSLLFQINRPAVGGNDFSVFFHHLYKPIQLINEGHFNTFYTSPVGFCLTNMSPSLSTLIVRTASC